VKTTTPPPDSSFVATENSSGPQHCADELGRECSSRITFIYYENYKQKNIKKTATPADKIRAVLEELGTVTVFRRMFGDDTIKRPDAVPEPDIFDHICDSALVVVNGSDTAEFWTDLALLGTIMSRNSLVLLLPFASEDHGGFSQKLSALLKCELPSLKYHYNEADFPQASLWFRDGVPELQPVTRIDRSVARLVSPGGQAAILKFLLYPAVAQQKLRWRTIPRFNRSRWALRTYSPLGLLLIATLTWLLWDLSRDPGTKLVTQNWRRLESDLAIGDLPGGRPRASHLDADQSLQLGLLKSEILTVADDASCAGFVDGDSKTRDRVLAKLPEADINNYFYLVRSALSQPEQVGESDLAADFNAQFLIIEASLSEKDRVRMIKVVQSTPNLSGSDGCWFERTLLRESANLPEADRVSVVRSLDF
jgi:hypothetical protein